MDLVYFDWIEIETVNKNGKFLYAYLLLRRTFVSHSAQIFMNLSIFFPDCNKRQNFLV